MNVQPPLRIGLELDQKPTPAVATLLCEEWQNVFSPLLAGREK